jgi:hypothetical protein
MSMGSFLRDLPHKITYRHVIPVATIGLLVALGTLLAVTNFSTRKPRFCLTCHYWQAYSNFMETSKVHPTIDCAECHADAHQRIPKDYKAEAERVEPNCRRCHADVVAKQEMTFKHNEWNIQIPHAMHVQDVGLKCTDCHMNVMHDRHVPHTNRPQMETCFGCHDPVEMKCSACHPKGAVELPKTGVVTRSECRKCHPNFAKKALTWQGHKLNHRGHVGEGIDCNHCHSNAEKHGTIILDPATGCTQCHVPTPTPRES